MALITDINQHINAVMETMGWPEDAFIPIANDENRRLMRQIEEQMEAKKMKTEHRVQLNERVNLLKEHHQNTEAGINQNLVRFLHCKNLENRERIIFIFRNFLTHIASNPIVNITCLNWLKMNCPHRVI